MVSWQQVGTATGLPGNIVACTREAEAIPVTCVKCNRVGHAGEGCELPPAPYAKVGVEIEGYWNDLRLWAGRNSYGAGGPNGRWTEAGLRDHGNADGTQWEFRTREGTVSSALQQLYDVYPDGTNQSCGMHVHVSFTSPVEVSLLGSNDFLRYWDTQWEAWGKSRNFPKNHQFWARFLGNNTFCRKNASLPEEACEGDVNLISSGSRYQQLNWASWHKGYQTLECRMLPMFDNRSDAFSAILRLVTIYDEYLMALAFEVSSKASKSSLPKGALPEVSKSAAGQTVPKPFKSTHRSEGVADREVSAHQYYATRPEPPATGNKLLPRVLLWQEMRNNVNNYKAP